MFERLCQGKRKKGVKEGRGRGRGKGWGKREGRVK